LVSLVFLVSLGNWPPVNLVSLTFIYRMSFKASTLIRHWFLRVDTQRNR
jgi:hypothetical protein